MKYAVLAWNVKTGACLTLGEFPSEEEAQWAIDNDIEWDEDDNPDDWDFTIELSEDEYEEPADIDDDFGFDPYAGCFTYDC
jgi:hypothetical protein